MSADISTTDLAKVDLTDLDLFADGPPHALFARMRQEAPVHWNKTAHGAEFWSLTRAEDITDTSKDAETFSSASGGIFLRPQTVSRLDLLRRFVIFKDPPDHTQHRSILGQAFLPRTMIMLDELIKDIVSGVLDDAIERGECDLVHDIASPIATSVIARLMGAPATDVDKMLVWADVLDQGVTRSAEMADTLEQMSAHFLELVGNQVVRGVDSFATSLAEAEIDGKRLSEEDIAAYFCLLLFVGSNPTRSAISSGMLALLENPEQLELLRTEPSRLRYTRSGIAPTAIDEILRWSTPLNCLARTATRDTTIRGVDVKSGDRLILWYASASRDTKLMADADTFDITRGAPDVAHYAFGGGGPHYCQGANLTHRVLSVAFREIFRRLANIEQAGDITRVQSPFINSLTSLPISFTPAS